MRAIAIIAFIAISFALQAQLLQPQVALDTATIRIGEQVKLSLSIPYSLEQGKALIEFPEILDKLSPNIEVVAVSEVDSALQTPDQDPYLLVKRQTLTITSWDSGFWAIPPFVFWVNGKEVETQAFLLEVQGVAADTAKAYRGITDIERLPFSFTHWLKEHWTWLAGGAATLALAYALFVFLRKRPAREEVHEPVVIAPLHVRILEQLERIEQRKIWQGGKTKLFYSEVTEVLRAYVEEKYEVPALERSTYELKRELKMSHMPRKYQELLIANLEHADMVKFAKYKPIGTENEALLENAFRLVRETSINELGQQDA